MNKAILVTGGNRGIGLEVSRMLAQRGHRVLLGARDAERGQAAATALQQADLDVRFLPIDVTDPGSIESAAHSVEQQQTRLTALVNNAGASFDGFDATVARETLAVNFFGPLRVTDRFHRLMARSACIVMVSSGMGKLSQVSRPLARRLLDHGLSRDELLELMSSFPDQVGRGEHSKTGWPGNAYSTSKVGLNALTRILARDWRKDGMHINAVDPGWVRTRMGGAGAPRSVEQGAEGVVWAATLSAAGPTGGFFHDGEPTDW